MERPTTVSWMRAVTECLPAIGTERFLDCFVQAAGRLGIGQVTAFAYNADRADCLLSRNFSSEKRGETLAAAYVDGRFREDPLYRQVMGLDENYCTVCRLDELMPNIKPLYFAQFFRAAGFRTKTAVLVAQDSLRLVLNIYYEVGTFETPDKLLDEAEDAAYRLVGRAIATHFVRQQPTPFPPPLIVLSERERQVCLGMLAGKKAEIIADEMGIGASSVVTYRQRAYFKLGITSRGQLFSICRFSPIGG